MTAIVCNQPQKYFFLLFIFNYFISTNYILGYFLTVNTITIGDKACSANSDNIDQ